MGTVIVGIRVMPTSVDVDLEKLKNDIRASIPEGVKLCGMQDKYIAFGLTAIDVTITMPDNTEGGSEKVEQALLKIPNVQSIDIIGTGLL